MSGMVKINGQKVRDAMTKAGLTVAQLARKIHGRANKTLWKTWVSQLMKTTDIEPCWVPECFERLLEKVLNVSAEEFRARCWPPVELWMSLADDADLISASVLTHFRDDSTIGRITVDSFPRLGSESLSRVYRVEVEVGEPHKRRYLFIKIGNPDNIKREKSRFDAYTTVRSPVQGISPICHDVASYMDLKCNGFSLALNVNVADSVICGAPETLDTRLKHHGPVGWVRDQHQEAVLEMFRPQGDLQALPTGFDWLNEYSSTEGSRAYLHWDKVSAAIEGDFEGLLKQVDLKRPGLADPIALFNSLKEESRKWAEIPVKVMTVHGDTHQRNIILQPVGQTVVAWLIDFDWSRQFHALVDYTLLEASLKTFYYARYIHPDRMPTLHDRIDANGTERGDLDNVEHTLVDFLRDLRQRSQAVCGTLNSWRAEYHLSSFLVTLGLLTNFACSPLHAWETLAWLAGTLLNQPNQPNAAEP